MISNYNLDCGYHNFELKDKIYLVPDWALKVIYTDGFNEVVYSGNSSNVTLLEGHEITFQEETSFDERFKFSKVLSLKVNGYKTFNDLDYRYYAIIETKDSEFYIVNVDFPSFVTHTYTLNANTNETELVFSSQSNIATLKLTNFEPNNVNSCNEYSTPKVKKFKLTESWASSLSTWQKSLINKGTFSDIEPLQDSISLTEEFDGEKYTVTLGFDIPMSHFKNDWHIKLLQFTENKYRGYIQLEGGTLAFVGYNVGLFPSYTINGDIIAIRLQEVAIRGIAYGNDYAIIDTDIPNTIEYNGATCYTYNWLSTCDWHVEDKPEYITISPTSGMANTQYELEICNTDDETGYEVSEFIIKVCNAGVRPQVIVSNRIYRWLQTEDTVCIEPITRTISGYPYCNGYDKYVDVTNEISYDSGITWEFLSSSSTLVESASTDCGYNPYLEKYFTITALGNGAIKISKGINYTIYYSKDSGATWSALYKDGTVPVNSGDTVMWKRNTPKNDWFGTFSASCRFNVEGNIMSLIYGDNFSDETDLTEYEGIFDYLFSGCTNVINAENLKLPATTLAYSCYYNMFKNCSSLETAPQLPAINLANHCYDGMFRGCASLSVAPELPATTLTDYCYWGMFSGCTSLTTAPELPATTLKERCYDVMFSNCTSLTTAPELHATTLAEDCYNQMLSGCTSLTTAPSLPATTLAEGCYSGMFVGCTSLTTAPELPATVLTKNCYSSMFSGCTSLTTAPVLSATTLDEGSYSRMFYGCSSLNEITCLATDISANGCTYYWVVNVNRTGTFYKNPNMTGWSNGYSGIPNGWQIIDYQT